MESGNEGLDVVKAAAHLSLQDRVAHKQWKVREDAYKELLTKFGSAAEDSKIYPDFAMVLTKIVRDANAPAQLVGLEAVGKFADRAPPALVRHVAAPVGKAVAEKALSGRAANKKKASECVLFFVGADAGEQCTEAFVSGGFAHKTPKVVATAVDVVRDAVLTYGASTVAVKPVAAALAPLFKHSNADVRKAAKSLVIELHRWLGAGVKSIAKNDAPGVTIKELDAAFEANAALPRPKPCKLTRAMEERVRDMPEGESVEEDDPFADEDGEAENEADVRTEIDFLPLMPKMVIQPEGEDVETKGFLEALVSKKWRIRKDALSWAIKEIGVYSLTPGPYGDVVSALRKIFLKDANVNVIGQAAILVSALASGLRGNLLPPAAKALTVDILWRMKEKNKSATDPMANALDALHINGCIAIAELKEEIVTAASSKVPKARTMLFLWLDRCFAAGTRASDLKGPPLKSLGNVLTVGVGDATGDVRDAAFGAMAALFVLVGERNFMPYIEKLDKVRTDKVLKMVKERPPPKRVAAAAPASKAGSLKVGAAKKGPPAKKGAPSQVTGKANARPKPAVYVSDDEGESGVTSEDALALAATRFDGFEPEQWSIKSFKARAAAVEVISAALRDGESVSVDDANLVLSVLTVAPGLHDSNFMALKAKLELLGLVAEKCIQQLPRKTLRLVLEPAVDKLGDIKCAMTSSAVFITVAEATSPRFVFEVVAKGAKETTNARAKIGIAKFASTMVADFGIPAVSSDTGIDLAAFFLQEPPAALRNAAVSLAGNIAIRTKPEGAARKGLDGKIEVSMLELFDGEVAKYKSEPDAPTRKKGLRPDYVAVPVAEEEPAVAKEVEATAEVSEKAVVAGVSKSTSWRSSAGVGPPRRLSKEVAPSSAAVKGKASTKAAPKVAAGRATPKAGVKEDSSKPVSLAEHFGAGSSILKGLKSSDWKSRQQALAQIDVFLATVTDAGGLVSPIVGSFIMPELRARFGDSNKNIAAAAVGVAGRFGEAMGPKAVTHAKTICPPLFASGCVDIKASVRNATFKSLGLWHEAIGLAPMVSYLSKPLATLNPGFKKEYLEWLVPRLKGNVGSFSASDHDLTLLVDPCLTSIRDKTADVRQLAVAALGSIVSSVGFSCVENKVSNMTKSARLQLEPIITAFRDVEAGGKTAVPPSPRAGPGPVAGSRVRTAARGVVGGRTRPAAASGTPRAGRAAESGAPATPRGGLRGVRQGNSQTPVATRRPVKVLLRGGIGREARAAQKLGSQPPDTAEGVEDVVPFHPEEEGALFKDLADCVAESLYVKMTAPSNRFQLHVDAVAALKDAMRENPDAVVKCADVLIRWAIFRVDDSRTPPTMVVKACEFISNICEILLSSGTLFDDYEASAVIPVLVDKTGSNRTVVREGVLAALISIGDVMDDVKLMAYLIDSMWQTQNAKSRLESCDVLYHVVEKVCIKKSLFPSGSLTILARIGFDIDEAAGRAAAACLELVLSHIGPEVWNMIGVLTDEEAEVLESRFVEVPGASGGGVDQYPDTHHGHERGHLRVSIASPDPHAFRPEDFRLSVAPAPPSNVISALGDSMLTPKRAQRPQRPNVEQTPALPHRRGRAGAGANFSFISSQKSSQVQSVTDMLASGVRSDQEEGLIALFNEIGAENSPLLYECAGDVLPLLSRGFRDCVERLEEGTADSSEQHLLRQFLNALMMYVSAPSVIRGVSQGTVEQLLSDVMDAMIPDDMPDVDDWDRVRRGVNLAVLKLLETCDRNLLFTALFNLLLVELRMGSDPEDRPVAKSQLLVKSVAKVTKRGFKNISIDALLRDMNLFVTSLAPSQGWSDDLTGEDDALSLVRTVVDVLVKETGGDIYDGLSLIPRQDASPLVRYISKIQPLANIPAVGINAFKQPRSKPVEEPDTSPLLKQTRSPEVDQTRNIPPLTQVNGLKEADEKDPQDKLTDIFDHMLSSGGKDAGLRRLRAFMLCYPDIDIEPHIGKCSSHFQQFVRNGLRQIATESPEVELKSETLSSRQTSGRGANSSSSITSAEPDDATNKDSSGQAYLKRLKDIRLKYGLPDDKASAQGAGQQSRNLSKGLIGEKENGEKESLSGAETRDKATALRERMARIRESKNE